MTSRRIGELRMIYQSKAALGSAKSWKNVNFELPGVTLSDDSAGAPEESAFPHGLYLDGQEPARCRCVA